MAQGYTFANELAIRGVDTNTLANNDGIILNSKATRLSYMLDLSAVSGGDLTPLVGPGRWFLTASTANGDMLKAEYDPANNGYVDLAAAINGVAAASPNQFYGKNSAGVVGFHTVVSGGGSAGTIEDNGITINVETLSAAKQLMSTDAVIQLLDPDGGTRVVTYPSSPADNYRVYIQHTGSSGELCINQGTGSIVLLNAIEDDFFAVESHYSNGQWFHHFFIRSTPTPASNTLNTGIIQIGNAVATSFNIPHTMMTKNLDVIVWDDVGKETVYPTITVTSANINIDFGTFVPANNQFNVVGFQTAGFGDNAVAIAGDTVTATFPNLHSSGLEDLFTVLIENSTGNDEITLAEEAERSTTNQIDFIFTTPPAAGEDYIGIVYGLTPPGGTVNFSTIGDAVSPSIIVNHGLNTEAVKVELYDLNNNSETIIPQDIVRVDSNNVEITFGVVPLTNQYRCLILNTLGGV